MNHCSLLIKNVTLLNRNFEIEKNTDIAIDGNKITKIGRNLGYTADDVIDGKGLLAMPGLVDAHHHNAQQLLRAKPIDEYPMVWTRFLVPFESNLSARDTYVSAQLSALEMIKSGRSLNQDGTIAAGPIEKALAADPGGVLESLRGEESMRNAMSAPKLAFNCSCFFPLRKSKIICFCLFDAR